VPISGKPEIGAPPQDEVCEFKLHPPDPIGFLESIYYAAACSNFSTNSRSSSALMSLKSL
jgi:hypothetical protein